MIRGDECCQHLGEYIDSAPLVVCQNVDGVGLGKDRFRLGADFYFQTSRHTLGQLGEIIGGQDQAERLQTHGIIGGNRFHHHRSDTAEVGLGRDLYLNVSEGFGRHIFNRKLMDDRYFVLLHREINKWQIIKLHPDFVQCSVHVESRIILDLQYYKKYGYYHLFFGYSFVGQENIPTFAPDL